MQELEKVLEEIDLVKEEIVNLDCGGDYNAGLRDMAMMAKQIIRNHMNDGWIPVEKALPEYGKKVLAYGKSGEIDIANLYSRDKHMWLVGSMCSVAFDIIAWRTLPAPYRPEKSEK